MVPRKRLKGKTTVVWFLVNKKIIPMAKAPGLGLHRARNAQAAPHAPAPGPRCAVCNGIFLAGAVVLPCPLRCDPGQLFHDHCIGQHLVIVHAEGTTVPDANAPGPHLPPQGDAPGHAEGTTAHDADAPGPHLPPHGDAPGHAEGIAPFAQAANCDLGFDGAAADLGETSASAQDLASRPGVLGGG